jgi:hypothetical protein
LSNVFSGGKAMGKSGKQGGQPPGPLLESLGGPLQLQHEAGVGGSQAPRGVGQARENTDSPDGREENTDSTDSSESILDRLKQQSGQVLKELGVLLSQLRDQVQANLQTMQQVERQAQSSLETIKQVERQAQSSLETIKQVERQIQTNLQAMERVSDAVKPLDGQLQLEGKLGQMLSRASDLEERLLSRLDESLRLEGKLGQALSRVIDLEERRLSRRDKSSKPHHDAKRRGVSVSSQKRGQSSLEGARTHLRAFRGKLSGLALSLQAVLEDNYEQIFSPDLCRKFGVESDLEKQDKLLQKRDNFLENYILSTLSRLLLDRTCRKGWASDVAEPAPGLLAALESRLTLLPPDERRLVRSKAERSRLKELVANSKRVLQAVKYCTTKGTIP